MVVWKNRLSRLTLSTVSLLIFAGVGALVGAIAAGLFELMILALFSVALPLIAVVPIFMAIGIGISFFWGLRVVVLHTRPDFNAAAAPVSEIK